MVRVLAAAEATSNRNNRACVADAQQDIRPNQTGVAGAELPVT
jgi:hypothetical protein